MLWLSRTAEKETGTNEFGQLEANILEVKSFAQEGNIFSLEVMESLVFTLSLDFVH